MRAIPQIILITDPDHSEGLLEPVRKALAHGADERIAVQLRAKTLPDRALVENAQRLRELTDKAHCLLLINGRADIAMACAADGVHLPEDSLPVPKVREMIPARALIGRSCHDGAGITVAAQEKADYATLGPLQRMMGKNLPLAQAEFASIVQGARIPVLALGGVDEGSAQSLVHAGAHGIAVIRAVLYASDPSGALSNLRQIIDKSA